MRMLVEQNIIYIQQKNRAAMDTILEQKRKGQKNFRTKIDEFLSKSPYTKENDQLTLPIIQQLLSLPNMDGVCVNGKINVERLCEKVAQSEGPNSAKELQRLLGKKEMKVFQLYQVLKNFELTEFDIEEEMVKHFFEGGAFSMQRLDSVMSGLGMGLLNTKDREILIECFDYDRNKVITKNDVAQMMHRCKEGREKQRKELQASISKASEESRQA